MIDELKQRREEALAKTRGSIDADALAALKDHRHQLVDCGAGVRRCRLCMLELRSLP